MQSRILQDLFPRFPKTVTFVAEPISHHLPISAFYIECFSKKIQFSARIWTKAKFLDFTTQDRTVLYV